MYLKPGANFYFRAYTVSPTTAAPQNGDSLPTAALIHNGTADGAATPTVTNVSTGVYKVTGTVPSTGYVLGDMCQVEVTAVVGGVTAIFILDNATFLIETLYISDKVTLADTGLDALLADVTSDANARSSGAKMLRALFNRFFNVVTQTATAQVVKNDAGTTISTMTTSDDGTTATKGKSA